jgi:hypothetical protein
MFRVSPVDFVDSVVNPVNAKGRLGWAQWLPIPLSPSLGPLFIQFTFPDHRAVKYRIACSRLAA